MDYCFRVLLCRWECFRSGLDFSRNLRDTIKLGKRSWGRRTPNFRRKFSLRMDKWWPRPSMAWAGFRQKDKEESREKVEASYCGWPWISPYTGISWSLPLQKDTSCLLSPSCNPYSSTSWCGVVWASFRSVLSRTHNLPSQQPRPSYS